MFKEIYTGDELKELTLEHSISDNSGYWKGIKMILKNPICDEQIRQIALKEIYYILTLIAKKSKCLTAEQAGFLWERLKPTEGYKGWRIQHLFAGCVFDYWNLKNTINGSVGWCYYHARPPIKTKKFRRSIMILKFIHFSNKQERIYKKLNNREKGRLESWLQSIPFDTMALNTHL